MENFDLLKINNLSLNRDLKVLINIYKSAMSSGPWFEKLSEKIIKTRIHHDFNQPDSEQYIAQINFRKCACMWWDKTSYRLLSEQRGEKLAKYWLAKTNGQKTVWFRDILILKEYQKLGIGKQLVDYAIKKWKERNYKYTILRIHLGGVENNEVEPNDKALKIYQRKGFEVIPNIFHTSSVNAEKIKMGYMLLGL